MGYEKVYANRKYEVYANDTGSVYLHQPQPEYATLVVLRDGELIIAKQYRAAVDRETYELPGGEKEPQDANLEATARRELREETGLICGELHELGLIHNYACMMNRRALLFFTDDIVDVKQTDFDADELIHLQAVSVEEAFARIADGTYTDPELAHGLLLARLKGFL
ncbi:MAG TPA: NUDIX hydrolase [Bacilli bacterium]|nr:NUDIX hydrolase [Bacilli bacterium]